MKFLTTNIGQEATLANAIHYVLSGQGTQMEVYAEDDRAQDLPIVIGG